jgi:asparagine synthase (glutamine-hydrolysing)
MCGIAGFRLLVAGSQQLPPVEVLDRMTDALVHRGPDSRGVWHDAARGVGLGHRRLAIRDLSPTGYQPMVSACGRYVITYNGEIYSHLEIARDLEAAGCRLRGTSDTEIILEAFARWGVDAVLPRLIGMFAFALYDRDTGELVLVRDRLGIKPLYWGIVDGLLLFGSELKALRALPGWQPRVDRNALAAFMRHNYIPAPHTIYQQIHKLEAGTMLRLGSDGVPRVGRYWDLRAIVERAIRTPANIGDAEAVTNLDALLSDAVRRRMVADVPLGCLLSGGVDSSLVTALLQENSNRPIKTFSIGFRDRAFDEAPFAREVAGHLGTEHTELYVEPDDALGLIEKLPQWYDEPFADSSQIPTQIVCALTRRHVTVVLSGDGGDELFAGYPRYALAQQSWDRANIAPYGLRRLLARGILSQSTRRLDAIGRLAPARLRRHFGERAHQFANSILLDDPDRLYRDMLTHWHEPNELVLGAQEPQGIFWDRSTSASIPQFLDRMQFVDSVTYLPDDILTKVDRASMSVGLESRVPLLDHRVVERAWSLPRHMRMRRGESKWALRQVLYKRVPRALIDRPKMGFGLPLGDWMRGPLRHWVEYLLDEARLKRQSLFAPAPIRARWQAHLGGADWSYPLWTALMAQAWIEANPEVAL